MPRRYRGGPVLQDAAHRGGGIADGPRKGQLQLQDLVKVARTELPTEPEGQVSVPFFPFLETFLD